MAMCVCVELHATINSSFLLLLDPADCVAGRSVLFSSSLNTTDISVLLVPSPARMRS